MSKSSRRKRSRTRRRTGAGPRRPAAQRARAERPDSPEAEITQLLEQLADRAQEAHDPNTAPERVAQIVLEDFEGSPAPPGFIRALSERVSAEHARAVVRATSALEPGSVTALSAQAELALALDGDLQRARELMGLALAAAVDPDASAFLAEHLLAVGLRAQALEVLERRLAAEPADEDCHRMHAELLQQLHRSRASGQQLGTAELDALERFADRALLYRLRTALEQLAERRPELAQRIAAQAREWLQDASAADSEGSQFLPSADADGEHEAARREAIIRLAVERAWLSDSSDLAEEDEDEEQDYGEADRPTLLEPIDLDALEVALGDEDDGEEDDEEEWSRSDSMLAQLARDPTTPSDLTRAARSYHDSATYGLWLLEDPQAAPGVWLTEILTGVRRYVAIAPEQLDGLARWSVLLGPLVALEGVWRTTGAFVNFAPAEGDRAAAFVLESVEDMMRELSGRRARGPSRKVAIKPHGVLAQQSEPADPLRCALSANMVSHLLPTIAGGIWESRRALPRLVNMEGHPLKLITARLKVPNPGSVIERLAAHADFQGEDDGELSWWGRELTAHERDSALASVRDQLAAKGTQQTLEGFDEQPRWLRGRLRLTADGQMIEAEINSEERLTALMALMDELGVQAKLAARSVIDPGEDLAAAGPVGLVGFGESAEAVAVWQRNWPDQPTPALDGLTPRAAARRKAKRAQLESLLRTLEHDADALQASGRPVPDLAAVRAALGIER